MKINLPGRQRWLAIAAGAMVGLYILDQIVIEPVYAIWKSHSAEIVRLQQSVARGHGTLARAAQTEQTWADMQATALPKDPAQTEQDMISAFDRWGRANNIELGSIRPQWRRGATDRYSLLECRVDAVGSMATLSRFMYELENSPLAFRVESVEVTSRDESGQKLGLALLVTGLRLSPLERKP